MKEEQSYMVDIRNVKNKVLTELQKMFDLSDQEINALAAQIFDPQTCKTVNEYMEESKTNKKIPLAMLREDFF